jgi:hypothetical protein
MGFFLYRIADDKGGQGWRLLAVPCGICVRFVTTRLATRSGVRGERQNKRGQPAARQSPSPLRRPRAEPGNRN